MLETVCKTQIRKFSFGQLKLLHNSDCCIIIIKEIIFSGIYYAFWCYPSLCTLYMLTVVGFIVCGALFRDKMNKDEHMTMRLAYFLSFVVYGFIPTLHWAFMNGFDSHEVKIFLPRIVIFYLFLLLAFPGFKVTVEDNKKLKASNDGVEANKLSPR